MIKRVVRRVTGRDRRPIDVFLPHRLDEVLREGPAPLQTGPAADSAALDVAFVVPSFRRVSGGHSSIASLVRALEARGHSCSIWIVDDQARSSTRRRHELEQGLQAWFGPIAGPVRASLEGWKGADVVVATAWQTVPATLRLAGARGRAYFVQDHEPDFYGASAERRWAAWTYQQDLHPIVGSPWLARVLREQYDQDSTLAEFGFDQDLYRRRPEQRRRSDLVLFYARPVTGRRGTALGLLALQELKRRRPAVEVAIFGEERPLRAGFAHTHLGVVPKQELAQLYATASAGMVLSLTNPSLIPLEMAACGLPCVDIDGENTRESYEPEVGVTLAAPTPVALCAAIESVLDRDGGAPAPEAVARFTWVAAAERFEAGLHAALAAGAAA